MNGLGQDLLLFADIPLGHNLPYSEIELERFSLQDFRLGHGLLFAGIAFGHNLLLIFAKIKLKRVLLFFNGILPGLLHTIYSILRLFCLAKMSKFNGF